MNKEAKADLFSAIDWHESKQIGLAEKFLLDFENLLSKIEQNPKMYVKVYRNFRKAGCAKFAYALYYEIDEANKLVEIFAITHTSRNPTITEKRIKNRF